MNMSQEMLAKMFGGEEAREEPPTLNTAEVVDLLEEAKGRINRNGGGEEPEAGDIVEDVLGDLSPFKIAENVMLLVEKHPEGFHGHETLTVDPNSHQGSLTFNCVVGTIQLRQTDAGEFKPTFVTYLYDIRYLRRVVTE